VKGRVDGFCVVEIKEGIAITVVIFIDEGNEYGSGEFDKKTWQVIFPQGVAFLIMPVPVAFGYQTEYQ